MNLRLVTRLLPAVIAIALFALACHVFYGLVTHIHIDDIRHALAQIPAQRLLLALGAVALAYGVLPLYDWFALKALGARLPARTVFATALIAYPVGHTLGVSVLSAGAIRYRYYYKHGLSHEAIANIVWPVSLSLGLGMAFLSGVALLLHPLTTQGLLAPVMTVAPWVFQALGGVMLSLLTLLFVLVGRQGRSFTYKTWSVHLPSAGLLACQLMVSVLDLMLVTLVIYLLLPTAGIGYWELMSAFVQATLLGVISHVPAGAGVFEFAMIKTLPTISTVALVATLLLYRLFYFVLPFALALIGIGYRELGTKKTTPVVLANTLSFGCFATGIGSVLLALTAPSLIHHLSLPVPATLLMLPRPLVLGLGLLLIITAWGLRKRMDGAWRVLVAVVGMLLLTTGVIHGVRGAWGEMMVLALLLVMLIACKSVFIHRSVLSARLSKHWLVVIGICLVACYWVGLYLHFGVHGTAYGATHYRVLSEEQAEFWQLCQWLAVGFVAMLLFGLIRFARIKPAMPTEADIDAIRPILANTSDTEAFFALMGDKQIWQHPNGNSFLMYQVQGRSCVVLSDPIGCASDFDELLDTFLDECANSGLRPVFYQVTQQDADLYNERHFLLLKLGEEATVDLRQFEMTGGKASKFRQIIKQGDTQGLQFAIIPKDELATHWPVLRGISDAWLENKKSSEKGFSLGRFDEQYLTNFDVAVVKHQGHIIAFCNLLATENHTQIDLDLMRYDDSTPHGVMDYMFVQLFVWAKAQGYQAFGLGMSPLSGLDNERIDTPHWYAIASLVKKYAEPYYNFTGLRQYKQKFHPQWQPRYLAVAHRRDVAQGLADSTLLISGGIQGLLKNRSRFGGLYGGSECSTDSNM